MKRQREEDVVVPLPRGLAGLQSRTAFLSEWFGIYGGDDLYEIEVKVKDVSERQFAHMRDRLRSFAGWESTSTVSSTDVAHSNEVRGTVRPGEPTSYMLKRRVDSVDVAADGGVALRFTVSTEEPAPAPLGSEPTMVRLKTRHSFNRKREFNYDLTEVRSGRDGAEASKASMEYEVELEWVGQAGAEAFAEGYTAHGGVGTPASALALKFVMKAQDLVDMAVEGRGAHQR
jgi:hypothetical protein